MRIFRLVRFSLPMIAGNMLQQVYNLVDTLVVAASQRLGADGAARLKELHRMKQQFGR